VAADEESRHLFNSTNTGILRFAQNDSAESFFNKLLSVIGALRPTSA